VSDDEVQAVAGTNMRGDRVGERRAGVGHLLSDG
jgi:hypothetical protein